VPAGVGRAPRPSRFGRRSGLDAPPRSGPSAAIGSALALLAGRSIGVEGATWLGRAFVVTGSAAVLSPTLALVAGAGVTVAALGSRRAARRRAADAVVEALPEVIDLFGVAVGAGLPVAAAIGTVAGRSPPPVAAPLRDAARRMTRGQSTAEALAAVERALGPPVGPLIAALTAGDRLGSPLRSALAELGAQARLDRRRRAEEAARRLPVTLLFPLVCCTLPAFGLLTVVPLIVGSLQALRL
jgi:Flp pilus assembly protein TadB